MKSRIFRCWKSVLYCCPVSVHRFSWTVSLSEFVIERLVAGQSVPVPAYVVRRLFDQLYSLTEWWWWNMLALLPGQLPAGTLKWRKFNCQLLCQYHHRLVESKVGQTRSLRITLSQCFKHSKLFFQRSLLLNFLLLLAVKYPSNLNVQNILAVVAFLKAGVLVSLVCN